MTNLTPEPGQALFARYASPPNELGYCGPVGAFDMAGSGEPTSGVAARARQFAGAWPYLEIVAATAGIDDPLDHRVVEAYWVGNDLLDRVDPGALVTGLAPSFADQVGGFWQVHLRRTSSRCQPSNVSGCTKNRMSFAGGSAG